PRRAPPAPAAQARPRPAERRGNVRSYAIGRARHTAWGARLMATAVQAPRPPQSSQPGYGGGHVSLGKKLRAPGFYRAAWLMVLGVAFAFFLTWVVRASTGHTTFKHYIDGE